MSDCLNRVSKETCQNPNRLESVGSTSDRLKFVLNHIHNVKNQNKITAPSIGNTYEIYITQKFNSLDCNFVDITKVNIHKNVIAIRLSLTY